MVRPRKPIPPTVKLHIIGPKAITGTNKPVLVQARIANTWLELLNDEMGLQVAPDSGVFICPRSYTPTAPKNGQGWRSELHQPISEFTGNFERRRAAYSVRLCDPEIISLRSNITQATVDLRRRPSTPGVPANRRASSTGPQTTSAVIRRAQSVPRAFSASAPNPGSPNIVIPIRAPNNVNTRQNRSSNTANGSSQQDNYQRPRYSAGNTNGSQQLRYGTRLKRLRDQADNQTAGPSTSAAQSNGHETAAQRQSPRPQKKIRFSEPTAQTGSRQSGPVQDPAVPRIHNVRSIIKVEVPVTRDWDTYWDESEAEDETETEQQTGVNSVRSPNDTESTEPLASGSDDEDDDADSDNLSLCTEATAEENELRRQGIQVEDVKSLAEGRMSRFSNAYLLRVRNEIRKLRANNLWDRNVNRSPLACYYLQELFKE